MNKSDKEIVDEIMRGNSNAFSLIINRYQDKGMTLAYRILNNREDAEEALQDAFLRSFKALNKFEWKSSFSTWFYRILYNVCMSKLNKRKQEYTEEFDQIQEINILHCDNYFDTEAIFESERFKTMIQTELDKLDSIYSTILTLFYVQELSYTEIIDITGLPLGTIKNRLFRARNLLKESIIKNYHELPV